MLNNLFTGIFDAAGTAVISVPDFLLCIVVSLVLFRSGHSSHGFTLIKAAIRQALQ